MQNRAVRVAWRTSLAYWIAAVLWILFSDEAVTFLFTDQETINRLQTWKGWTFVTVTAGLLFVGLQAQLRRWEEATRARMESEAALLESERNYRTLTENHPDLIVRVDRGRTVLFVNRAAERLLQRPASSLCGRALGEADLPPALVSWLERAVDVTESTEEQLFALSIAGVVRHFEGRAVPEYGPEAQVASILAVARDVTEITHAREAQARAQKLEALGTMAGGIAHDFNNLLFAINGNAEMALADLSPDHPAHDSVQEIAQAGQRATELVRRILTFSRPRDQKLERVDLPAVLEEALKLLRASVPAMVDITSRCDDEVPAVAADRAQIHQLVLNLGVNASHAIGARSGRIEFELRASTVAAGLLDVEPGTFVVLTVRDTGCGMDGATMARIFDPFFTTKPVGEGTGLGLSIVHGVMKSLGGTVAVESEPGAGTTFRLYFPSADEPDGQAAPQGRAARVSTGGHVLYVDDEPQLRYLAARALSRRGYVVTPHADPREALAAFEKSPQQFDFVITDMGMPYMSGLELAIRVLQVRPESRVVLISGHLTPSQVEEARAAGVAEVLNKPETYDELVRVLDRLSRPEPRASRA